MENFNKSCYRILKKVPKGYVVTYKQIADKVGTKAYRAVGSSMKKNKDYMNIPCHRVINSNGSVGRYNLGTKKKIELLKNEGIDIRNNKIDLKKYGFKL